ncbi:copper chaperone PCu(A)C [Erythrobacter mangrovi]|uniref:Copper chaperone PCu(A)C n=1 Tax=Erythrobacter mangrovi TaxID=2739433 RepID=A0A7D3XS68_9SPHN|nr:copper chaperone PCu(A)C [Erythrobacter mangrovi]QKG71571.1 copper chaperone PCu(A)C [Erythrobacter mangrovi]
MKFSYFACIALASTAISLSGCGGKEAATEAVADTNAAGLEVTNARLVLPAVSGNPGAVYFDVKNIGEANVAIRKAAIKGAASAQIHDTTEWSGQKVMGEMGPVMIPAGRTDTFKSGAKHIMAFDLDPSLTAGSTTEMTLTIAGGKTSTVEIAVVGAGDDR